MKANTKLQLERVEDRCVPAIFGIPWLSPDVSVSFVPDGTSVNGAASSTFSKLPADGLTTAQWQGEIQRALQAWASATDLNFGFVADGGQSLGISGRIQGDSRFGDLRISSRPLGNDVLAITVPPGSTSGTRAGDIILNSDKRFAINPPAGSDRYDLYTVLLQEVGHAIGVGNNKDVNSAMYEIYQGTRTGLSSKDIQSARDLYGITRSADTYDEVKNNSSISNATPITATPGTSTLGLRGDITTSSDVDVYSFKTPSSLPNGVSFQLNVKGLSQLAAKLEVLDASGKVLYASVGATSGADLNWNSTSSSANTTYFVRVSAPSDTNFGVGSYKLKVVFDPAAADPLTIAPPIIAIDNGTDDTVATATTLSPQSGTTAQAFYRAYGQIESSNDVDFYRIAAPDKMKGNGSTLNIQIATFNLTGNVEGMANSITVYDKKGNIVPMENFTYNNSLRSFQIQNVKKGEVYTVAVKKTDPLADKNYELTASYTDDAVKVKYKKTDNLVLKPGQGDCLRTLTVKTTQLYTLSIESQSVGTGAPTTAYIDVIDATGKTIYTIAGTPGNNYGAVVFLVPGEYTLRLRGTFASSTASPLLLQLRIDSLSDPIGLAPPTNPTITPTTGSTPPTTTTPPNLVTNANNYYGVL